jgi:hypothetical protein
MSPQHVQVGVLSEGDDRTGAGLTGPLIPLFYLKGLCTRLQLPPSVS